MPRKTLEHYSQNYARKYWERTLQSPYTYCRNLRIGEMLKGKEPALVLDIGSNINPLVDIPSSMRRVVEGCGHRYYGLDLNPNYFHKDNLLHWGAKPDQLFNLPQAVAGDAIHLPFQDASIPLVISADVIEHIPDPQAALYEISRVLQPEGQALIAIPSLYKLDAFNFRYIGKKRATSHETKLNIVEWFSMFEQAGLDINHDESTHMGLASGLSYLSWVHPDFVPQRLLLEDEEIYTHRAILHKQIKQLLAEKDPHVDNYHLNEPSNLAHLTRLLTNGELVDIFKYLEKSIDFRSGHEQQLMDSFIDEISSLEITDPVRERLELIRKTVQSCDHPDLILGNSVIISVSPQQKQEMQKDSVSERISIIIKIGDSIIMLLQESRGRKYVVLPGGKREKGESVETAAARELREELSLRLREDQISKLQILGTEDALTPNGDPITISTVFLEITSEDLAGIDRTSNPDTQENIKGVYFIPERDIYEGQITPLNESIPTYLDRIK